MDISMIADQQNVGRTACSISCDLPKCAYKNNNLMLNFRTIRFQSVHFAISLFLLEQVVGLQTTLLDVI